MREATEDTRKRFPKLSKLGVAILEHLAKPVIGEEAIAEAKKPYADKQIAEALGLAVQRAETEFIALHTDKAACDLLLQLPVHDLPDVAAAMWAFYKRPNDRTFAHLLEGELNALHLLSEAQIKASVDFYLKLLERELVNVERELREKIQAGAMLDIRDAVTGKTGFSAAPLPTIVPALFTISRPVSDFTGRGDELANLKSSFSSGALITGLSGGGGIGKTELARKFADAISTNYPAARLEIDLLGTSETPIDAQDAMRRLLEPFYPNQKLPDDSKQLKGVYDQTLSAGKALLLLDNAADAAQVRHLIPPAPSAAIITSRQYFSLSEYGLSQPLRLDVLPMWQARALLRTACPRLSDAPDPHVDELAGLCGRLPLALRVAAALLITRLDWTVQTLIDRLADERTRLQRLKLTGDLDVEATLNLSYDCLTPEMKRRYRQLAVFAVPFPAGAARAVWGMEPGDDAQEAIGHLLNRNLLNVQASIPTIATLYGMHDLTRLHATHRLLQNKHEARKGIERHANYVLEWAAWADDEFVKGHEHILTGLEHFRQAWPHLLAAYERLLPDQTRWPRPAMADAWLSAFPTRCIDVLQLSLAPKRRTPLLTSALAAATRLGDEAAQGTHLGNLGVAYGEMGEERQAIALHERALAVARKIGNRRGEGGDLSNLGLAYAELGDTKQAIEFYGQALIIHREIGNPRAEGNALNNLGLAHAALGRGRQALESYEQALVIYRDIGDLLGQGNALGNIGVAYLRLGEVHKGVEYLEKQLVIVRDIGYRMGEGSALSNLATAYYELGEVAKAIEFSEQSLGIARETGDRILEAGALTQLGLLYFQLNDRRRARDSWKEALLIYQAIQSPLAARVEELLQKYG